jgi:ATP-dependent HslUV protease ATP-binding subunit HslU
MIGPTGVGKTEIARRLARLADAPFIKVEATKFTEVGYVGKDVDTIVRDLVDVAVKQERERQMRCKRARRGRRRGAHPRRAGAAAAQHQHGLRHRTPPPPADNTARQVHAQAPARRHAGRQGDRDRRGRRQAHARDPGPALGMEEMAEQLKGLFSQMGRASARKRKLKIGEALPSCWSTRRPAKLVNEDEIRAAALANAEGNGIVFIDEIDKVASRSEHGGADVSRQGVQRDLLPLVEGTTVSTKYGMVKTDHMLFIASGAFHLAKPSDLIPELQGRFPIRVELDSLSVDDFEAILTSTQASLVKQYQALLATEGVTLEITPDGRAAPGADRLRGQRAHREHRRAPPGHGDGAAARRRELRRAQPQRPDGDAIDVRTWTTGAAWPSWRSRCRNEDLSRYIL